jgi:hypothetical protein
VVPNTLAGHFVLDGKQFHVQGRPVHLCHGHASSWCARGRKLLSVRLKNRGYLSAYNEHGYGSVVTIHERIDFTKRVKIPKCWSAVSWSGRVPDEVAELLGIKSGNKDTHEG